MDQPTFADLEYQGKKRRTRRELFLERMEGLIPWRQPVEIRAGSFPMFGHWGDKEIHYKICENTFVPTARQTEWVALVTHAFHQWEASSYDLITMHPTSGSCRLDDKPISALVSMYNPTNEVYMVDHQSWDTFLPSSAEFLTNKLFECIKHTAPACVISPDYLNPGKGPMLDLGRTLPVGFRIPGSVDVLIQQRVGSAYMPNIPGTDMTLSPDDVRFNTCQPRVMNRDPDSTFYAYTLMLHEAGHLTGLSGLNEDVIDTDNTRAHFEMSHPTLPESVLNYDSQVPHFWSNGIAGSGTRVGWEPDCSPHPFDIMALYALYQTVD